MVIIFYIADSFSTLAGQYIEIHVSANPKVVTRSKSTNLFLFQRLSDSISKSSLASRMK